MISAKRLIFAAFAISVLLIPELLWHKLTLFVHLLYEGISFVLEHMVMHVFGISKYFAQMAVFYFLWLVALLLLYVLWRKLPELIARFKEGLQNHSEQIKYRIVKTWYQLSIDQKIILLLFPFTGIAGGFIFLLA